MAHPRRITCLPDPIFTFDNTSVSMIRSDLENYQFVMDFNDAFRVQLARIKNLIVEEREYPCYCYYDEIARLAYVIVDIAQQLDANASLQSYNKILLLQGHRVWERQKSIYSLWETPPSEPEPSDYYDHQRWKSVCQFVDGIYNIDTFSFKSTEPYSTSLHRDPTTKMPKTVSNYIKQLHAFLTPAFDELSFLLDEGNNEMQAV